jgi:ribose transport system substrate-binding protein
MKRWISFLCVLAVAGVAGCGGNSSTSTGDSANNASTQNNAQGGEKLQIAVIPKMLNNPVFGYAKIGAERAAKQLGNVEVEFTGPPKDDPVKQAEIVDAMVAKGVDGILIACADPNVPRRAIDKAVGAGIPVITFDSDSPQSKRVAYYGVIDESLGARLGDEMSKLLKGKGRVAILSGAQGALNLQNRVKGVKDALVKHPNIKIIDTFYCKDDLQQSEQIVTNVTRSQKPDGWIFVGGWPLFTKNGLSAITPGKTKVVSADPLPETWHWIEGGYVQVALGQKLFGWGEEGTKLLVKAINDEKIPTIVDSGFDVVTPKNLKDYQKKWVEMSKE